MKKKNKVNWKAINYYSIKFSILLFIGFMLYTGVMFFVYYHNTDMCANGLVLNAELEEYGVKYGENSVSRTDVEFRDCYMEGMEGVLIQFSTLFIMSIIIVTDFGITLLRK